MSTDDQEDTPKGEYSSNNFPLPLKIAWVIFVLWLLVYLFSYMVPDLKNWIS